MHAKYLKRCFELAKQGETLACPNPIVGCVIVHQGKIISEGFHRACGEAHAEVEAITACSQSNLFKKSTIYVSLEPCAHHGKTPPCADLIIKHQFKELVFSSYDPNPEVSGKGIERIKTAGIKVIEPKDLDPKLKEESDYLNRMFFKWIATSPAAPRNDSGTWISLKIALTSSGEMTSESKWITNSESRKDVHRMRSTHDLIITGAETIRQDDSSLDIRHEPTELGLQDIKNPDVVVLHKKNKISNEDKHKVFNLDPERKVFQSQEIPQGYKRIMVETGPRLSNYFLESNLVDEVIIYQSMQETELDQSWQEKLKQKGFKLHKESKLITEEQIDLKETWNKK